MAALPCCQETLWRWVNTFSAMAPELFKTARKILAELKPNFRFEKDKRLSAAAFPSAHSKIKNQNLNLLYQIFILREYFNSLVEPKYFLVWLIFVNRQNGSRKSTSTRFTNDQKHLKRDNNLKPP
ncbi:hypothetical protein HY945_02410 [Candidatus Gottesmanbacteria bacterium]|nr:hypothetical protein [Candidatus Gottesmanbacteria bacterium]